MFLEYFANIPFISECSLNIQKKKVLMDMQTLREHFIILQTLGMLLLNAL